MPRHDKGWGVENSHRYEQQHTSLWNYLYLGIESCIHHHPFGDEWSFSEFDKASILVN